MQTERIECQVCEPADGDKHWRYSVWIRHLMCTYIVSGRSHVEAVAKGYLVQNVNGGSTA